MSIRTEILGVLRHGIHINTWCSNGNMLVDKEIHLLANGDYNRTWRDVDLQDVACTIVNATNHKHLVSYTELEMRTKYETKTIYADGGRHRESEDFVAGYRGRMWISRQGNRYIVSTESGYVHEMGERLQPKFLLDEKSGTLFAQRFDNMLLAIQDVEKVLGADVRASIKVAKTRYLDFQNRKKKERENDQT